MQRVPNCRYLGVIIIDEKLKWADHITYVYNKVIQFVGIFYKLRDKLPSQILKNIYYAFVHPHILYGIELYGNTRSGTCCTRSILNPAVKWLHSLAKIQPLGNLAFRRALLNVWIWGRNFRPHSPYGVWGIALAAICFAV